MSNVSGCSASQVTLVCVAWMDGWMTCSFTPFSAVLQSYQNDERIIMKDCVQWNPVYDETMCNGTPFMMKRSPLQAGTEPGTARSVGQRLTH